MISVYSILTNTLDKKDILIKEDRSKIQLEFALERMAQDIEQMYSPLYHHSIQDPKQNVSAASEFDDYQEPQQSFQPSERFPLRTYKGHLIPAVDSPDKSSLIFFSSAHRRRVQNAKQSRFNWVLYELRSPDADEKNELEGDVLIRKTISENIYDGEHSWDDVKGYALLKNITELSFMFWNEDTKKFVSSPRELNEKKNSIRMIKIDLSWIAPDNTELSQTRHVRVLWPYYNTKKDEKIIKEAFGQVRNERNSNEKN